MNNTIDSNERLDDVISLAEHWQKNANHLITLAEKANQSRLQLLILHPLDKAFLTKLIDQCFRSKDVVRIADQITYLLKRNSFPDFLSIWEILQIWLFLSIGRHFPKISVPLVMEKIRKNSGLTIIQGEPKTLASVLSKRKKEQIRMNVTRLAPSVLGEKEAGTRFMTILDDLRHPDIDYISVKLSSIYPQIDPFAFDDQLDVIVHRLSDIFRVANSQYTMDENGQRKPKFVNLDVESCTDQEIASEAFRKALDQEEFKSYTAGIALQAYLPESNKIQRELTSWAMERIAKGGEPIKLRIVKGASLEMEKITASLNGWPLVTFDSKIEVDANFKRMIDFGLSEERFKAVQLGIASHNIFELAYGYQVAKAQDATENIDLEMLYGVAGHIQRAIREDSRNLVLYAPVARKNEFIHAIGYLIRRLDENTAKDSFLRYAIGLKPEATEWTILKDLFIASCKEKDKTTVDTHRIQNRLTETVIDKAGTYHLGRFDNEPFTDWSIRANREWSHGIRRKWSSATSDQSIKVPLVINGQTIQSNREEVLCRDPSLPESEHPVSVFCLGLEEDIDEAMTCARLDPDHWRNSTFNEHHQILSQAAQNIRRARADLIGAITATTGKTINEADKEISRAIDYVEYYPHSIKPFIQPRNLHSTGKGIGVVITPKTDGIALSANGIAATLATGNTVILKPSSAAVLPAWLLCLCFWEAGISKKTLQFVPGKGSVVGLKLAIHPETDFVIFSGQRKTAQRLLEAKPDIQLYAQTGGKNTIIVTPVSDKDEAVTNIIESAFSANGQKSSAVSLLILEKEVYEDDQFKQLLVDAAATIKSGSAWEFKNRIGPLNAPVSSDLERALTQLEPGESWALKPSVSKDNPLVWSPGIKWDVKPGSFTHLTELFGPLLGVMCADDFQQAIDRANQTGYGASAGLECLDKRKQEYWKSRIKAGNLYINGKTVNESVLRQPYGGWGKSILGRGTKSGGANYVSQFLNFSETGSPAEIATQYDRKLLRLTKNWIRKTGREEFKEFQTDIQKTVRAMNSYLFHAQHEFKMEKDFFHLRGQDNIIRYRPVGKVVIRVHQDDSLFEILARVVAAQTAGCKIVVSIPEDLDNRTIDFLKKKERRVILRQLKIIYQTDEQLISSLPSIDRIRYAGPTRVPWEIYKAAVANGQYIAADKVLMEGRIELLNYYRSQTICHNYHRYGNLGARAFDQSMDFIRPMKV